MKNLESKKLLIVTPVFNDWEAFELLVKDIDLTIANNYNVFILAINDGSIDKCHLNFKCNNIFSVKVINLIANIGHQRAISVGLSSIDTKLYDSIVVMDCDGEDKVSDIVGLIDLYRDSGKIIVSRRKQRSESIVFKIFYYLYKFIFRILTGRKINFGNFSLLPSEVVSKVTALPELWNNYPAALLKLKLPIVFFDTSRGDRYFGRSKMNFVSLLSHGFSAVSVFLESILIRLLITFSIICFVLLLFLGLELLFNLIFVSEWVFQVILFSIIVLIPLITLLLIILLVYLNGRSNISQPIQVVYTEYIMDIDSIYKKNI